jgi:hypothetical protein
VWARGSITGLPMNPPVLKPGTAYGLALKEAAE